MLEELPEYGISIIGVDPAKFDAGLVYLQEGVHIEDGKAYGEVERVLAEASGKTMATVIDNWETAYAHRGNPQNEGMVTHAPKVTSVDAEISFRKQSGHEIYRRYLAIGHQEALRSSFAGTERAVYFLDLLPPQKTLEDVNPAGSARLDKPSKSVWIKAADGSWMGIRRFRIKGKSSTFPAIPFFNDFKLGTQSFL
jgi:methionyl-tRNA formyltransferase